MYPKKHTKHSLCTSCTSNLMMDIYCCHVLHGSLLGCLAHKHALTAHTHTCMESLMPHAHQRNTHIHTSHNHSTPFRCDLGVLKILMYFCSCGRMGGIDHSCLIARFNMPLFLCRGWLSPHYCLQWEAETASFERKDMEINPLELCISINHSNTHKTPQLFWKEQAHIHTNTHLQAYTCAQMSNCT